jgi:hypothetical protein
MLGIAGLLAENCRQLSANKKDDVIEMNMSNTIVSERRMQNQKPLSFTRAKMASRYCSNLCLKRVLSVASIIAVIVFLGLLCSTAFGANPAEEMAKAGAKGGVDPKGDSWVSIQKSIEQFAHPSFILRLFLSLTLAVGCAFAIAWHPRRASLRDPMRDFEERKALIFMGVVGAVVAELSGTSQTLAFVIFGIGALLRFRTLLDNPKLTGKAIMIVVVGLACGMGSWAMAVFVTAFSWLLMFWLDSHSSCEVRIRLDETEDPKPVFDAVQSLLLSHKCKLQSSSLYEDKGRMVFLLYLPYGVDPTHLEHEVRSKLRKNNVSKITVDLV